MKSIRFDVFGRDIVIVGMDGSWRAFYPGNDGKRRPAKDLPLPPDITESELIRYLDDLCHEWATEQHPKVRRID